MLSVEGTWTQCSKGESCSFRSSVWKQMRSETRRAIVLSCTKSAGTNWRKETLKKFRSQRWQSFWHKRKDSVPIISLGESVRTRRAIIGTLPCVSLTGLNQDAHVAKNANSDTLRSMGSPARSQRKVVRKDQLHYWRSLHNWGCVSQDSYPRKSIPRKDGKLGSNHTVTILQGHVAPHKNSGKNGSIARRHSKVWTSRARSVRFQIWRKDTRRNLAPRKMRPQSGMGLGEIFLQAQKYDKPTLYFPIKARAMPAPTSKTPEEREFVVDYGAPMHMMSEKDVSSDELDTLRRSRNPTTVVTANGEVQTNEKAEWPSGQKPHLTK